jgi:hypothetical protein
MSTNTWRDISTAPKGVPVLVSYLFHGKRRASQVAIKEATDDGFMWPSRYYEATHWQPLPAAPEVGANNGGEP